MNKVNIFNNTREKINKCKIHQKPVIGKDGCEECIENLVEADEKLLKNA